MPWVFYGQKHLNEQFRVPQGIFLDLTFMGIITLGLNNFSRNKYKNFYLSLFIGYLFFKIFINMLLPIFMFKPAPLYMLIPSFHVFLGVSATYIAIRYFRKEDYIRFAKALCYSSVGISIFALLQYFGLSPFSASFPGLFVQEEVYRCGNRMSACLDNPNLVGMYLVLTSPFFLYFRKPLYIAGYVLVVITTILTNSHFAWFCLLFSLFVYLIIEFRKVNRIIISIIGIVSIFSLLIWKLNLIGSWLKLGTFISYRLDCWPKAIDVLKQNPLFGLGLGYFKTLGVATQNAVGRSVWLEVHNDYLQYAVEIGLLGLGLFLLVVINAIIKHKFYEKINNAYLVMFITFLIFMIGSFPVEVPTIAFLGLLGFWAIEQKGEENG